MLKFKPYFYHSKEDSKQEPIDKIIALSYQDALQYFAEKKQMDEYTFLNLYTLVEDGSK
jgi:hypothetical protein